jgi:hypothetical protein
MSYADSFVIGRISVMFPVYVQRKQRRYFWVLSVEYNLRLKMSFKIQYTNELFCVYTTKFLNF